MPEAPLACGQDAPRTPEGDWRHIVRFGRNVASYKFALGQALLDLGAQQQTFVKLEDLAAPYAAALCEHLRRRAGQPPGHHADRPPARAGQRPAGRAVLPREVDARWNLVQMSWGLRLGTRLVSFEMTPDDDAVDLYAPARLRRGPITGVRAALSGYQDGRCAYCHTPFTDIGTKRVAVDHVLPFVLMTRGWRDGDLYQVWNLVLACYTCNSAKRDRLFGQTAQEAFAGFEARESQQPHIDVVSHLCDANCCCAGSQLVRRRRDDFMLRQRARLPFPAYGVSGAASLLEPVEGVLGEGFVGELLGRRGVEASYG
jgi:5-methylcytosine-specific restriction endonuclease McrA